MTDVRTVTVARACTMDAEVLSEVAAQTFALACPPDTAIDDMATFVGEALSCGRFRDYLRDPGRIVLKAIDADAIVGYVMLVEDEPTDGGLTPQPALELNKFYVLPAHHGTGTSDALMTATMETARDNDFTSIWLGVNQQNARAQRFYRKHGFDTVGTRTFRVGAHSFDDYLMQLTLP